MTVFDWIRNILLKEGRRSNEDVSSSFDPYMVAKFLSFLPAGAQLGSLLSGDIYSIPKNIVYIYYYNGMPQYKKVPFLPIKREKNDRREKMIELAKIFLPTASKIQIEEYLPLIEKKLGFLLDTNYITEGGKKNA